MKITKSLILLLIRIDKNQNFKDDSYFIKELIVI